MSGNAGTRRLSSGPAPRGPQARWREMSEYVFLFRTNEEDRRQAMGTPERAQKAIQTWITWMRDLEAKGLLKSYGKPLETAGKVVRRGSVTDGPFADAARIAQGCPFIAGQGSVEVRPVDLARATEL